MNTFADENDKNGHPGLRRFGVGTAALLGSNALTHGVAKASIYPMAYKAIMNSGTESMNSQLESINKLKGSMGAPDVNVHLNTSAANRSMAAYVPEKMFEFQKKMLGNPSPGVHIVSPTVNSFQEKDLGFLAHEIGHHKNVKALSKAKLLHPYMATRMAGTSLGSAGGALGAAFAKDDKTARNIALVGTGLTLPTIAEEATATFRGIKGLTKYYGSFGKAMKQGGGLRMLAGNSSYLALPAAPLAAYGIRKLLSKKEKPMNKQAMITQIRENALTDELEKIAKNPVAVSAGHGGMWGAILGGGSAGLVSRKIMQEISKKFPKAGKAHTAVIAASMLAGAIAGGQAGGYIGAGMGGAEKVTSHLK